MAKQAKQKKPWHQGTFRRRGDKIKAAARANPSHQCWRCGLTIDQARQRWGPHIRWTAGHLTAGQVDGPMEAECSHCASKEGQLIAARNRRQRRTVRTPLTW